MVFSVISEPFFISGIEISPLNKSVSDSSDKLGGRRSH